MSSSHPNRRRCTSTVCWAACLRDGLTCLNRARPKPLTADGADDADRGVQIPHRLLHPNARRHRSRFPPSKNASIARFLPKTTRNRLNGNDMNTVAVGDQARRPVGDGPRLRPGYRPTVTLQTYTGHQSPTMRPSRVLTA
jgi:hypothetical protein